MAQDDRLRSHAFTRDLSEEELSWLSALATEVSFDENQVILSERARSRYLYLLVSGSVVVEMCSPRCAVCVQALGPGEVFGWSSLVPHHDTLFRVRAREHTLVLRMDGQALAQLCQAEPRLGAALLLRVLRLVADRVTATEERFAEMCGVRVNSSVPVATVT